MTVRANPALDRTAIDKIIAMTVGVFGAYSDTLLSGVGSQPTDHALDELINVASRIAGISRVAETALKRCDVDNFGPFACAVAHDALGHTGAVGKATERLFAA